MLTVQALHCSNRKHQREGPLSGYNFKLQKSSHVPALYENTLTQAQMQT